MRLDNRIHLTIKKKTSCWAYNLAVKSGQKKYKLNENIVFDMRKEKSNLENIIAYNMMKGLGG